MSRWTEANIPDLRGKVAIVTGANSGLGLETSRALASHGARVIMACRSAQKAEKAVSALRRTVRTADLVVQALDLGDLASIRAFAQAQTQPIDLLINNAGIMAVPLGRTKDGFETQIGTNHLGHFALTGLLLGRINPGGRVVCVSSIEHRRSQGVDLGDLNWETRKYDPWQAYRDSKLANLLFMFELNRRVKAAGKPVTVVGAHPGYSSTNLQYVAAGQKRSILEGLMWRIANTLFAQPARMGALPSLYAATADTVAGGDFIGPDGYQEIRGYPTKVESIPPARDEQAAAQLWSLSQRLTGVSYS